MTIYRHHHAPGITEAGCQGCAALANDVRAAQHAAPTNPNDPTGPSTFDGSGFPLRHVGLTCDNCEEVDLDADVPASTRDEAFVALRRLAAEQGWSITPQLDLCPECRVLAEVDPQSVVHRA